MTTGGVEVLIGHPGGPFWATRDVGAWTIPKGLVEPGEDALATARREFAEETGMSLDDLEAAALGSAVQRSGKVVKIWAVAGDLDPLLADSNMVTMEWPRGSGRILEFPEIDKLRWCGLAEAARLLNPALKVFVPMWPVCAGLS